MNSLWFEWLTTFSAPFSQRSTAYPLERRVVNVSSTAASKNSGWVSPFFLRSVRTCTEYASIPLRSAIVRVSPSNYFQKRLGRWKGRGDLVLIQKPSMYPRYVNISWWVGVVDAGFKVKQSLLSPWSFLLFGVLIKSGKQSDSNSSQALVSASLKGPPTSMLPSPASRTSHAWASVPFILKPSLWDAFRLLA